MRKHTLIGGVLVAALAAAGTVQAASAIPAPVRPTAPASAFGHSITQVKPAVFPHPTSKPAGCATPKAGRFHCAALVRADVPQEHAFGPAAAAGLSPADLQAAYSLPSETAGDGATVAIVDNNDDPNAEADLQTYRKQYNLPECSTANGCFKKMDEHGGNSLPPADAGWATEIALDLDAVSAVCPKCKILLLEGDPNDNNGLPTAVNTAVSLGAKYVSNSYVSSESADDPQGGKTYYDHPGVAVVAATGDNGYQVNYPASYTNVVAVGGTTLSKGGGSRGWSETAWSGAGSGCSQYQAKPSWQTDSGCAKRATSDVSAVADPASGMAIYNTYQSNGWTTVGGTSLATPVIAGVYALAGAPAAGSYPVQYPYQHTSALNDVTSGSNGSCDQQYLCNAGPGYDGPTGLGTPNGLAAFTAGGGGTSTGGTTGNPTTGNPTTGNPTGGQNGGTTGQNTGGDTGGDNSGDTAGDDSGGASGDMGWIGGWIGGWHGDRSHVHR